MPYCTNRPFPFKPVTHINKTTAVWFGSYHDSNIKLCQDLGLKWASNFKLLGILFNNFLENMEINVTECLDQLKKLLNNWKYRFFNSIW